jgi:hypothetical protein
VHSVAESLRRALLPGILSILAVVAALAAIGAPDPAAALDFAVGRFPTNDNAVAAIVVVTWGLLGVVLGASLASVGRGAAGALAQVRRRRQRALGILAVGAMVLLFGVLRQAGSRVDVCCGSIQEASQVVR